MVCLGTPILTALYGHSLSLSNSVKRREPGRGGPVLNGRVNGGKFGGIGAEFVKTFVYLLGHHLRCHSTCLPRLVNRPRMNS